MLIYSTFFLFSDLKNDIKRKIIINWFDSRLNLNSDYGKILEYYPPPHWNIREWNTTFTPFSPKLFSLIAIKPKRIKETAWFLIKSKKFHQYSRSHLLIGAEFINLALLLRSNVQLVLLLKYAQMIFRRFRAMLVLLLVRVEQKLKKL